MSMMNKIKSCLRPIIIPIGSLSVAFLLFLLFFKNKINIGGLFSTKEVKNKRNEIPENRKTEKGPININESDPNGYIQADASKTIKNPTIIDEKDEITVVDINKTKEKIKLPTGVENKDVEEVVIVKPKIHETINSDKTSIDTKKLLSILKKPK